MRGDREEAIRYTHHGGGGALVLFEAPGGGALDADAEEAAEGSLHFGGRGRGILAARKAAVRLISHLAGGAESSVAFASMSVDEIFESEEGRRLVTSRDEWALINKWLWPVGLNGPMVVGRSPEKKESIFAISIWRPATLRAVRATPLRDGPAQ